MMRFVEAVERSLSEKNWYSALAVALTLPDMCGRLQSPSAQVKQRYKDWWSTYIAPEYIAENRFMGRLEFLTAGDAYALRCSFLHEGGDNIEDQKAKEVINQFRFVAPIEGSMVHCNRHHQTQTLQLQVDVYCQQMCAGVREWLQKHKDDEGIRSRMKVLLEIHHPMSGFPF